MIEAIVIIIAAASVLYCAVTAAIAFSRFWKYGDYPYWMTTDTRPLQNTQGK